MVLRATLVLLLVAALWSLGRPGRVALRDTPPRPPDAAWPTPGDGFDPPFGGGARALDPGPHRAAIERVESLLYRRAPAGPGDAAAVESALSRLGEELLSGQGLADRQAGLALLAFAARVGSQADTGYALASPVALRREWEAVRARVFRPAPWLRVAAPDLDRVQEPPPAPADPRSDGALRSAAVGLERLIARGRREVERLGEPVYDPDVPGRGDGGQIRAWHEWGARWRDQLAETMAPVWELSPPPTDPPRSEALRALDEAHELLRRVPDGAGAWPTPFRPSWDARFRGASDALSRARTALARTEPEAGDTNHARLPERN